jgi:hypothetical protein
LGQTAAQTKIIPPLGQTAAQTKIIPPLGQTAAPSYYHSKQGTWSQTDRPGGDL